MGRTDFSTAADTGFPTRSLLSNTTTAKSSKLQIQIPPNKGLNGHESPSPTPFPGPESAPIHPFAHSTAKLELLPPSTAGLSGIDIEEEAQLYDELRRTAKLELPPVNNPNILSLILLDAQFAHRFPCLTVGGFVESPPPLHLLSYLVTYSSQITLDYQDQYLLLKMFVSQDGPALVMHRPQVPV